jgi:hypothetical protein
LVSTSRENAFIFHEEALVHGPMVQSKIHIIVGSVSLSGVTTSKHPLSRGVMLPTYMSSLAYVLETQTYSPIFSFKYMMIFPHSSSDDLAMIY